MTDIMAGLYVVDCRSSITHSAAASSIATYVIHIYRRQPGKDSISRSSTITHAHQVFTQTSRRVCVIMTRLTYDEFCMQKWYADVQDKVFQV